MHTKFKFKILPKNNTGDGRNENTFKNQNSEETENDEDDDALKHVNLFSKYQNRSLKFGAGTFFSRPKTSITSQTHAHNEMEDTQSHTHKEMKHIRTITHTMK